MVHIYHLHTAMPSEVMAQKESILHCMDALERLSELWLVGKMVRNLFEAVLTFDGFDFRLKHASQDASNQKLTGMKSDQEDSSVTDGSTSKPQNSDKSLKALPLTPSLVAHLNAALKSATSQTPFERLAMPRSASGSAILPYNHQEEWQYLKQLAPRSRSEYHGINHNPSWMDSAVLSVSESTGLNVTEWFVSRFYLSIHCFDFLL